MKTLGMAGVEKKKASFHIRETLWRRAFTEDCKGLRVVLGQLECLCTRSLKASTSSKSYVPQVIVLKNLFRRHLQSQLGISNRLYIYIYIYIYIYLFSSILTLQGNGEASIEWRIAFNRMAGRNNGEGQQLSSPCNYVTISGLAQRACPRISCTFNSYWVILDDWLTDSPKSQFSWNVFFRATTLRQSMVLFWLASAIFQSRLEYQVLAQYLHAAPAILLWKPSRCIWSTELGCLCAGVHMC